MRAFRVIRIFGRVGSLRDIIAALTAAITPVTRGTRGDDVEQFMVAFMV